MADRQTIAAELKTYISAHSRTQREAADKCRISPPHFANLLNGKEAIGYSASRKIAGAFPEIDPDYLLTGDGVLTPPSGTVRISQSQKVSGGGTGIQSVGADQALAMENAQLREQLAQAHAEKDRLLGIIETLTKK